MNRREKDALLIVAVPLLILAILIGIGILDGLMRTAS